MREIRSSDITGVLLAGGKARRMGGEDKGLLPLAGRPLAARTLARLAPQTGAVVVSANRNIEQYAAMARVIKDDFGGFCGPLAGIHAGLRAAAADGWALCAPCDAPFLPRHLARDLARAAQNARADVAVAAAGGRLQPVFMLVRAVLQDDLADFLSAGGRKIDLWHSRHSHVVAEFADAEAFANINTPEELAAAAARFHSENPQ